VATQAMASAHRTIHDGTLRIHRALGVPQAVSDQVAHWGSTEINVSSLLLCHCLFAIVPTQYRLQSRIAGFFASLRFVAISSLDDLGRPWVTLVTALDKAPVIRATAANALISSRGIA